MEVGIKVAKFKNNHTIIMLMNREPSVKNGDLSIMASNTDTLP